MNFSGVLALLCLSVGVSLLAAAQDLPYQVGDQVLPSSQELQFSECHPDTQGTHRLSDFDFRRNGGQRYVTVISTYYTNCGPGRYESPTFSRYADGYAAAQQSGGPRTAFLASLKLGVNDFVCRSWATLEGQNSPNLKFIDDADRSLQYLFFTNQHPAYVVLDHCQRVRQYFREGEMKGSLKPLVDQLLGETDAECPVVEGAAEESPPQPQSPPPPSPTAPDEAPEEAELGPVGCVEAFGAGQPSVLSFTKDALPQGLVAPGGLPFLDNPRDLAFNPATRELWVLNNNTQSVTLFGGLQGAMKAVHEAKSPVQRANNVGTDDLGGVTVANRRDRGYYHYMARPSAITFDERGHFATCQESENNYDFQDLPNFFMGPTLYNASDSLLFQADGEPCTHEDRVAGNGSVGGAEVEPCFVAHIDMLHESPVCVGIAHDPETETPWGNVYWVVGSRFEPTSPEYSPDELTLLRYDFEKPHGIGVLDHSLANVRRYHEVSIKRRPGVPGHIVVDPSSDTVYIADTGNNRIVAVDRSTGSFDNHARVDQGGEFLLFSATEPSFEYSVYHCLQQNSTWAEVAAPSGIAVDENFLYVSEHDSGHIVALEKGTGREAGRVDTGAPGVMGIEIDPETGNIWFVNGLTDSIGMVQSATACAPEALPSGSPPPVSFAPAECGDPTYATLGDAIPHPDHDCGYQNQTDMCLGEQYGSSRENCTGPGSFNLDMLLMTGFYCHRCLPDPCLNGGSCENIWSKGYKCICPAGFEGTNCQRSVPVPPSSPPLPPAVLPPTDGPSPTPMSTPAPSAVPDGPSPTPMPTPAPTTVTVPDPPTPTPMPTTDETISSAAASITGQRRGFLAALLAAAAAIAVLMAVPGC